MSAGVQDNQQVVGEALEPVEFQEGEVIFRQVTACILAQHLLSLSVRLAGRLGAVLSLGSRSPGARNSYEHTSKSNITAPYQDAVLAERSRPYANNL